MRCKSLEEAELDLELRLRSAIVSLAGTDLVDDKDDENAESLREGLLTRSGMSMLWCVMNREKL